MVGIYGRWFAIDPDGGRGNDGSLVLTLPVMVEVVADDIGTMCVRCAEIRFAPDF